MSAFHRRWIDLGRLGFAALLVVATSRCADGIDQSVAPPAIRPCEAELALPGGLVSGAEVANACAFRGIPFASSAGAYRFRRPGPAPAWTGVHDGIEYRPDCLQLPAIGFLSPGGLDEECLNLNVWRPRVDVAGHGFEGLPVMVFFYGGAFMIGGASWFLYDGADLAEHGVVVVTANYRLGPLGFYARQELAQEDQAEHGGSSGSTGNYGIWDQVAALQWVHDHIDKFGGDPDNVTIFGESAGGWSVCTLLASPATSGLVHKAIMESGNCVVYDRDVQMAEAATYIAATGCAVTGAAGLECLRALDARKLDSLGKATMFAGVAPAVDSELLVDQPIVALRNGQASGIPLLAGYNRDEMKPVAILPPIAQHRSMGWDEFWRRLRDVYSDPEIHALQQLYPQTDYDNVVSLWTDVFEDLLFSCGAFWAVAAQDRVAPSYLYAFDVGTRSYGIEPYMGSFHSLELSYVFGNYAMLDLFFHESNSAERIIEQSEMIQRYWTRFARTGDPNGGGDPVWPRFGAERVSLQLSPTPRVTPGLKGPQCDFWSTRLPIEFSAMFDYMMKVPRNAGIGVDFNEMLGLAGGDGE